MSLMRSLESLAETVAVTSASARTANWRPSGRTRTTSRSDLLSCMGRAGLRLPLQLLAVLDDNLAFHSPALERILQFFGLCIDVERAFGFRVGVGAKRADAELPFRLEITAVVDVYAAFDFREPALQ